MSGGGDTRKGKVGRGRPAPLLTLAALMVLAGTTRPDPLVAAGGKPETVTSASDVDTRVSMVGRSAEPGEAAKDNEEIIVEVYLRRTQQLSGGIVAYAHGDDLLVPLQELMILLELAIEETPQGAAGWYLSEDRRFVLDLKGGIVQSGSEQFQFKPADVKRIDKHIYVSAKALSRWLPLTFHADMRSMQLHVNPSVAMPMEERAKRNKGRKYGSIHQFRSQLPKQETPYAAAQVPAFEVDLATGYSSGRSVSGLYTGGTARAFGDFAFMNGEAFVTGDQGRVYDARIRLGRVDPDGGLLGPLNATQFWMGDVGSVSMPLVSQGMSGRGVSVTSRPQGYVAEFDRITLEGSVPAGHEIELYRNGILMPSNNVGGAGRYRFDNVPLLRGANEIRLEFYGPQGQRRTETNQYFVGDQQVPVGKLYYDFIVSEVGRSVFGFANWVRDNRLYDTSAVGGAARFDYGLLRNLSITGGVAAAPLPTRTREITGDDYRYYTTFGVRTNVLDYSVGVDGALDDKGGTAAGVSAQTAFGAWTMSARHEQFMNGYASDTSLGTSYADRNYAYRTSHSSIRLDTFVGQLWSGQLHLNAGVVGNYTTFKQLDDSWRAGVTLGASMGRFSLSNDLYYGGAVSRGNQGVLGSARASVRLFEGVLLRAGADYDLRDKAEVQGFNAGLTAPLPYDVTFGIGYAQRFDVYRVQPNSESYFTSLRRRFGWAEVGVIASYNKYDQFTRLDLTDPFALRSYKDEYRAVMTISFSTFTDPKTLKTEVSSDRIARQGAIRPVAFHDVNQNGVRDPGEPLLENVRINHAAQSKPHHTGSPTSMPMTGVAAGGWMDLGIDRTGIPDPVMSPGSPGVAVLPRPGVVASVDLPVVAKAGVEGRVDLNLGREKRGLPNVTIQIVRLGGPKAGEVVVKETNTEFDGAFALADVPVGEYVLRVEPEQARQIGARGRVERAITLTANTTVLDGVALEIRRYSGWSADIEKKAPAKPRSWSTSVCATGSGGGSC